MEIYAKQCSTYDLQIRCTLEQEKEVRKQNEDMHKVIVVVRSTKVHNLNCVTVSVEQKTWIRLKRNRRPAELPRRKRQLIKTESSVRLSFIFYNALCIKEGIIKY